MAARQSQTSQQVNPNAVPWLITYASQTGVAEQLAWRTATSLQEAQQPTVVKPIQQLNQQDLQQAQRVLFVVSTYGTGEAPTWQQDSVKSLCNKRLISATYTMRYWHSVLKIIQTVTVVLAMQLMHG